MEIKTKHDSLLTNADRTKQSIELLNQELEKYKDVLAFMLAEFEFDIKYNVSSCGIDELKIEAKPIQKTIAVTKYNNLIVKEVLDVLAELKDY